MNVKLVISKIEYTSFILILLITLSDSFLDKSTFQYGTEFRNVINKKEIHFCCFFM